MNNVILQSQNHSNTTKNVVQSVSTDEYLASFGDNLPTFLKDILSEINYPYSALIPNLSDDVNFGEFFDNELPKSELDKPQKKHLHRFKAERKLANGVNSGVGADLGNTTKSSSNRLPSDFQKTLDFVNDQLVKNELNLKAKSKIKDLSKNREFLEFRESDFIPINAKFNFVTGNLTEKEFRRSVRYKLLQVSQLILSSNHRVNSCLRYRINKDDDVKILQHTEHGCLHYGNLMRCGSVWLCPVCGSKISEVRRLELQQAKGEWLNQGGHVYMLTLTTPHYSFTDLRELIDSQAKALKYMWGGRGAEQLKNDLGLVGQIRAFEITYGDENGFHPHYHILLFTKVDLEDDGIYKVFARRFANRWSESCVKVGLPQPHKEYGCQLQDGSAAFEYINKFGQDDEFPQFDGFLPLSRSKDPNKIKIKVAEKNRWNSSHELTKANSKTGKDGRLTPHDFLRKYNENPQKYGALWLTFANGTRGKAQLFWSKGLKELLGIKKNNDEAIANNDNVSELVGENNDLQLINTTDKKSEIVYSVEMVAWQYVTKHRKQHHVLLLCKFDLLNKTSYLNDYLNDLISYEKSILDKKLAESPPKPKPKLSVKALRQLQITNEFEKKYGSQAESNPYPKGSPSWETWESKNGHLSK